MEVFSSNDVLHGRFDTPFISSHLFDILTSNGVISLPESVEVLLCLTYMKYAHEIYVYNTMPDIKKKVL